MKETNRWTPEEVAILTDGYKTGMSAGVIAAKLGRTENAVYKRAKKLGITSHIRGGKGGRKKFLGCTEDCFNCPYYDCLKPCGTFRESY